MSVWLGLVARNAVLEAENASLRVLAQKTADQECLYLREITALRAELAAFRATNVARATEPPKPNPFRDFPVERRRVGGMER